MKWFQHMTDAHDDEFVKELMHKFGSDGYTAWFVTAELVAKIVKVIPAPMVGGQAPKEPYKVHARLEAVPHVFIDATKLPPDRLEKVYEFCAKRKKFRFTRTRERWVIDWPKVLEFKDNTTSDLIAKYCKLLGSGLEASSEGPSVPPIDIGIQVSSGKEGGVEGERREDTDAMAVWLKQIMPAWEKMCPAPGERSKRQHIRDWIRQGVSRRAIEEAPMIQKYQNMDFFKIGNDLKFGVDGHGNNGRSTNPGAKAVLGHFALAPGELDGKVKRRIAERERKEADAEGSPEPKGSGAEGRTPQGDPPHAP
jgi:hypothetical protein